MKRWTVLYETCKLPIRVCFFVFIFIALGSLVLSDSVNIFYTITNPWALAFARFLLLIGQTVILNLPLVFIVNLVAKKANSGTPLIMALLGYITYAVVTMLFSTNLNLPAMAYKSTLGISYTASGVTHYPLHTGLIGAFIVAFATRFTFIASRNRSAYSFFGFLNKDTVGILYNILLCALLGILSAMVYPLCFGMVQEFIDYVARDLNDPLRIGMYGVADRVMSILGLGDLIREPFWFGSQGGSYLTIAGQTIVGDVNIWDFIQEAGSSYLGCGRFITPYYIINIFAIPAIYIGMFISMTDKHEKSHMLFLLTTAILFSILFGNPLPLELLLLFTSPLLLILYLLVVMILFGLLSYLGLFLGFSYTGSTLVAMPGSFPDYIIQLRNPLLFDTISYLFIIGIVVFAVCLLMSRLYFRYMAYNLLGTGKTKATVDMLAHAVGGLENIQKASSGLFRLILVLNDLEAVSFKELAQSGASRITETKDGVIIDFGSSSTVIARAITREIAKLQRT